MKHKDHRQDADKDHRLEACATEGGHMGPPLREESIIDQVVARGIREHPEQAAAEMVQLMRDNARLEAEVAMLQARVAQLAGLEREYGYS